MILPRVRDPRLITIRRGGSLTDGDHRLLALWAAVCAEHVLHLFEAVRPLDSRPGFAIEQARAWTRGEVTMTGARTAAGHANAAARELQRAARFAAYAAAQAAAVAHVAAHELGARPMQSRRCARLIQTMRVRTQDEWSAAGSGSNFRKRFGSWCWTISD